MITPYYEEQGITIYNGDCLEVMKELEPKSIDLVLTDPPYGITGCDWDSVLPLDIIWGHYKILTKSRTPIIITASQPFTTTIIASKKDIYRYNWVWEKDSASNFQLANKQPLKNYEDICVFYKEAPLYKPQGLKKYDKPILQLNRGKAGRLGHLHSDKEGSYEQEYYNYPKSIIAFPCEKGLHPTQKPVSLFAYFIETYTNEGDLILDNTMGSGTTLVAAKKLNRRAIGIEISKKYCDIAIERLSQHELFSGVA